MGFTSFPPPRISLVSRILYKLIMGIATKALALTSRKVETGIKTWLEKLATEGVAQPRAILDPIDNPKVRSFIENLPPPSPGNDYYFHGSRSPIKKLLDFETARPFRYSNEGASGAGEGLYISKSPKAGEFYSDNYADETLIGPSAEALDKQYGTKYTDNPNAVHNLIRYNQLARFTKENMANPNQVVKDLNRDKMIEMKGMLVRNHPEVMSPQVVSAGRTLDEVDDAYMKALTNHSDPMKIDMERDIVADQRIGNLSKAANTARDNYYKLLEEEDISHLPYLSKEGNRYLHLLEGPTEGKLKTFDRNRAYTVEQLKELMGEEDVNRYLKDYVEENQYRQEKGLEKMYISGRKALKDLEHAVYAHQEEYLPLAGEPAESINVDASKRAGQHLASGKLRRQGVEGTRWESGAGNDNYVIFDPQKKFKIKSVLKYALAPFAVGGAVAMPREDR